MGPGPNWQVQVDNFPRLDPGGHTRGWDCHSLVVLDEVGLNSMTRVWPKIEATVRDKIVVVVLQERKLTKPRSKYYYQDILGRDKAV